MHNSHTNPRDLSSLPVHGNKAWIWSPTPFCIVYPPGCLLSISPSHLSMLYTLVCHFDSTYLATNSFPLFGMTNFLYLNKIYVHKSINLHEICYNTFLGDRVVAISKYSSRRFDSHNQGRTDSPGLTIKGTESRIVGKYIHQSEVPIHFHYNGFTIRPRTVV